MLLQCFPHSFCRYLMALPCHSEDIHRTLDGLVLHSSSLITSALLTQHFTSCMNVFPFLSLSNDLLMAASFHRKVLHM